MTDLGCLTVPGVVGIIVRNETGGLSSEQRELKVTLDRLDEIQVKHVKDFDASEWMPAGLSRTLYWAHDFNEICQSPIFAMIESE